MFRSIYLWFELANVYLLMTNSLFLSTKLLRFNCVYVTVIDVDGHAKRNITNKAEYLYVSFLRLTRRFQTMYNPRENTKDHIFELW